LAGDSFDESITSVNNFSRWKVPGLSKISHHPRCWNRYTYIGSCFPT